MSSLIFSIILIISLPLFAKEGVKKFDLNKDGIQDRYEYYKKGKIVKLEEDRNNDRKIDVVTLYNHQQYFRVEKQDTDFDGRFDRKVSEEIVENGKIKITFESDKDRDGNYEIKYYETADSDQKNTPGCLRSIVQGKVERLAKESLKAIALANNGFLKTEFGYEIDGQCLDRWGSNFPNVVKEAISDGLKCFTDLDKKYSKKGMISGALRNAKDILNLLNKGNISLICSEADYDWTGTSAHASTSSADKITSNVQIEHPFISINPTYPHSESFPTEEESNNIKKTIFHEQLHNLGYRHGDNIEYPYACGDCCLSGSASEIACKVCLGDYTNSTDIRYVEDILKYSQELYREEIGIRAVIRYIKENTGDLKGISMLSYATSGTFNPIGHQLAYIIEANNDNLNESVKSRLERSRQGSPRQGKKLGKRLAEVYYELYHNKNGQKAIETLEKNKEMIKKELSFLEKSNRVKENLIASALSSNLDDLIFDMWINQYGEKQGKVEFSNRAYNL